MRTHWRKGIALVATLVVVALLAACGPKTSEPSDSTSKKVTKGPIRVGSTPDSEGVLLGQIIIQVLESHGFTVEDKTRTGDAQVVRKALRAKDIDAYPEYTANALLVFHKDDKVSPSVLRSATLTYEKAKAEDAADGITWLYVAPANNAWAIAVPKKLAQENKLATVTDLAKYINSGGTFKIAGSREFFTDSALLPAFEKAYRFKVKPYQTVQIGSGDTALPEKAAADGANGANATMAHGTDGTLSALNLVVLSDPKGAQPFYQPAPVFRTAVIEKYPEIRVWLSPVFVRLDMATLQSLNKQVSVEGKDPKGVAADWLRSTGFVK